MSTLLQVAKKSSRLKKKSRNKRLALKSSPQRGGIVYRAYTLTPKKPCSARRAICRVDLTSNMATFAHIPGIGHTLRRHSKILIHGHRVNDLPGVHYRVIRNTHHLQYNDAKPVIGRTSRRSKHGILMPRDSELAGIRKRNTFKRQSELRTHIYRFPWSLESWLQMERVTKTYQRGRNLWFSNVDIFSNRFLNKLK